jgi:hypothetical protein
VILEQAESQLDQHEELVCKNREERAVAAAADNKTGERAGVHAEREQWDETLLESRLVTIYCSVD